MILSQFLGDSVDRVELIYTKFVSLVSSRPVVQTLLPLDLQGLEVADDEIFRLTTRDGLKSPATKGHIAQSLSESVEVFQSMKARMLLMAQVNERLGQNQPGYICVYCSCIYEKPMKQSDDRQFAPATQRNRESILQVLREVLPTGTVLEISSGTGEHAVFFAPRLSLQKWIPSDPNPIARASIAAWREFEPSENLASPIAIDVREPTWSIEQQESLEISAIVNINMIHISSWSACLGLMAGANRILKPGRILYLYGPYKQNGEHTAPSNEMFDRSLQQQDPEWGVRNLEDVVTAAQSQNLELVKTIAMPANNLSVVFQKLAS